MISIDFSDTFKEEADDLLSQLETSLLKLEKEPHEDSYVSNIFRFMHTIKGSSAMFGFDSISSFTHDIETVFDLVRNKKLPISRELINLTLSACDQIKLMLDGQVDNDIYKKLTSSFKKLIPYDQEVKNIKEKERSEKKNKKLTTYRIIFKPNPNIFKYGTNPLYLLEELQNMGKYEIMADISSIPDIKNISPELCYSSWNIILTTEKDINVVKDVFIFVEDDCKLIVDIIDNIYESDMYYGKTGEILIERGVLSREKLEESLSKQRKTVKCKPIGDILVEDNAISREQLNAALSEQSLVREIRKKRVQDESMSSIRVSSERLDSLMNLVGELVINQAQIKERTSKYKDSALSGAVKTMERLISDLRDNTLSIRLLPVGTIFSKFNRLVRDLSGELGKEVEMITEGAETELDKTVIEHLNDPLVHLIRNCIDHGIETPDVRKKSGKPGKGTIHLSAIQSEAYVLIKIKDDGKGIDPEVIYAKGIEKGLISCDDKLSEKQIFELIMLPGFSTAKEITSVSGRGVGMDVVKQNIEALGGSIEIDSKKGMGTTITLKLPLTLAIIDGLLCLIGGEYFIFPLSVVERNVELSRKDIENACGRHIIRVNNRITPYIRLSEYLNISSSKPKIEQIVITQVNGMSVGFVVDKVIGNQQTVIKTLGRVFKNIKGLFGATILGNGTVALILDVNQLVEDIVNFETYNE